MSFGHYPDIDDTDRRLLDALNEDARASFAELAALVGLKAPSVHARVKRLEGQGVIRGYRAVIDPAPLGFGLGAFVAVTQASGYHWEELERAFAEMAEVEECHSVTGDDSYLLKVRVGDAAELEALLRRINMVEGVARTRTVLILSTTFDRRRVR
jgi:Lrp/AsnC family leucine-responsive transcriptional regulator